MNSKKCAKCGLVNFPNEVENLRRVSREMSRRAPAHAPQAPAAQV